MNHEERSAELAVRIAEIQDLCSRLQVRLTYWDSRDAYVELYGPTEGD